MRIQSQELNDRLILGAVGALQGLVIWTLIETQEQNLTTAVFTAVLTFILVSGAVIHFVWTGRQNPQLVTVAAVVGAVYAVLAFWVALQLPDRADTPILVRGDQTRVATWFAASLFSLYVLGPFLQIYQRTSRLRFPYSALFVHSWSNFHIALVGLLFVAVLWAVLGLWAALFKLLDVDFFADLFTEEVFIWTVTGGAVGIGLSLGREKEQLIATLRNITLSVFRALLPLLALVALMFLITMPFTGLDTLWDTRRASWILLSWVAYTILFLNAVYQDGSEGPPYNRPVRVIVEGSLLAMIVFCVLALFGLLMRVDQYGLTPPRFVGLITTAVFAVYIVGYSVSVVRRRTEWLANIRRVNVWMAAVLVAIALLLHTPLLDPLRWSARSQYNRLVGGKADAEDFDYEYLRFKLGHVGQQKLRDLKALSSHPERDAILAGVKAAEQAQSYARMRAKKLVPSDFLLYPAGTELPDGLLPAIRGSLPGFFIQSSAFDERRAIILAIDLDATPGEEYLVFPPLNRFEGYGFKSDGDGGWTKFGTYRSRVSPPDQTAFDARIADGNYATKVPKYRDVMIGEQRFHPTPY